MTDAAQTPTSYSDLFSLTGRHAVVVGGGSGIGREVARGLVAAGATVTVADVNGDAAAETAGLIGDAATPTTLDVVDKDAVDALAAARPADIAITTVGVNVRKKLADLTDADYDRVLDVNLRSVFRIIQAFAPGMAERRRGSVLAFASIRAQTVEPGQGLYAATKAGLIQLLRTAAAEYGPDNVRFNAVAPGVVATELTGPIRADAAWSDAYARKAALARWADPSEMVGAAVFLASDAASYMTGSVVTVDGGWTAVDGRFDPFAPR
jgi:NAD(P)-dependent dehydrogenase (short-subunit alcohol dehydrogenase family)